MREPASPRRVAPGSRAVARVRVQSLLDADPDLAAGIAPERHPGLREALRATVVEAPRGPWDVQVHEDALRGGIGLLVLEGALLVRFRLRGRGGADVIGPGDVVAGWDGWRAEQLALKPSAEVLRPLRLALLDRAFLLRLAAFPEVGRALLQRAALRGDRLLAQLATVHHPQTADRVLLTLWALADRFGRVTARGTQLELVLTHERLADLVAAQRPSVTLALAQLEEAGRIDRRDGVLRLLGSPPPRLGDGPDAGAGPLAA